METIKDELIAIIDKERIRLHMDQRAFSKFLGIGESYYSMLKSGARKPSLLLLSTLMQKLPQFTPEITVFIKRLGGDGKSKET